MKHERSRNELSLISLSDYDFSCRVKRSHGYYEIWWGDNYKEFEILWIKASDAIEEVLVLFTETSQLLFTFFLSILLSSYSLPVFAHHPNSLFFPSSYLILSLCSFQPSTVLYITGIFPAFKEVKQVSRKFTEAITAVMCYEEKIKEKRCKKMSVKPGLC